MLTKYIEEAMKRAKYELIEDGTYFGKIPRFQGVWGNDETLEGCREDLRGALEGWLVLKLWDNDDIPVLGKLALRPRGQKIRSANESGIETRTREAS